MQPMLPADLPDANPAPAPAAAPRSLWRSRDFLLLWSGQTVSTFGTSISQLALPLLVLALTHSPAQAGLVTAADLLPYLLLALPAGALVDRWDRKKLMIRSDTVRWLALGSVPLAFALGHLTVAQLYIVALASGTANVFFSLAQISALPQVVAPEQLPRAWALNETSDSAARLFGPGLAGFIIGLARTTAAGAALAYLADSVSYLASVISLRFVRVPFQGRRAQLADGQRRSLWAEMAEGVRFLWRHRRLRLLALLTMVVNFLQAPVTLAVILLAQGALHLDVQVLGLVFGASGAGGLLGALIAPRLSQRLRFGQIAVGSVAVWAAATVLLAVSQSPWPLILGLGLMNIVWPVYAVVVVTYRLSLAPDELQGRINSSFRMLTFGAEPLGVTVGGLLLVPLGPRAVLGLLAAGLALAALAVGASELRKM
ncbi:MAG: MFS-type drug/proton antiporter [Ktedonobacterales bacterium]|nr:MAG: MFS-type drug/proton antiporter [Ktedonobacterales bacterium]